ncbi:MAG: OprO/OprP family phosphate-selective porin [Bacteroidales bacterium]|nr:OprO/OprP family phosphate-selective porin [Bacteroidales bacterium]
MKKILITLGLCLAFSGFIYAQATEAGTGPRVEVNQYGQLVETFPLEVTLRNGVTWITNRERGYRFWFDGRVQIDGAWYHNQRNGQMRGPDGSAPNFSDPDNVTPHMPGGISLRRVRFAAKVEINDQWYGEIDFSAANGNFGLQDAYIQFNPRIMPSWQFRLGNFKEDFSMEYTTSSRFVTFMERPMCITAFNFTRRLGFQVKWHREDMPWLRASGGITGQEIDGFEIRSNVTANMQRLARAPGPNFTGKVVLMPWASDPDRGLHFGYNIQLRSGRFFDDDEAISGFDGSLHGDNTRGWHSMRVSSRNATAVNRTSYLDTRWIYGVRRNLFQGVELSGFWNGW